MSNAQAGWYDDGSGRRRWWDGAQWTEHFEPGQTAATQSIDVFLTPEQKHAELNAAVLRWAAAGWTATYFTGDQAVLKRQRRMGWFWNTVLVFFTAGLWLIYVIYRALNRLEDVAVLTIDDHGLIRRS